MVLSVFAGVVILFRGLRHVILLQSVSSVGNGNESL
jgi:hypothetical protein